VPLEAIAEDKFKLEGAGMVFEFDASKNQITQKWGIESGFLQRKINSYIAASSLNPIPNKNETIFYSTDMPVLFANLRAKISCVII